MAAVSVGVGLASAAVYAVGDYVGEGWIAIPQMARTHAAWQALGVSVCGLWGWRWANSARRDRAMLGTLTRRWQ